MGMAVPCLTCLGMAGGLPMGEGAFQGAFLTSTILNHRFNTPPHFLHPCTHLAPCHRVELGGGPVSDLLPAVVGGSMFGGRGRGVRPGTISLLSPLHLSC